MADTEAKKILDGIWASDPSAAKFDPEDVGIDRATGYPVIYSQIGSGFEPEREVYNQRNGEWDGWAAHHMRTGGYHEYDVEVDYAQWARSTVEGHKYVASIANGPSLGNATDPTTPGQVVWTLY